MAPPFTSTVATHSAPPRYGPSEPLLKRNPPPSISASPSLFLATSDEKEGYRWKVPRPSHASRAFALGREHKEGQEKSSRLAAAIAALERTTRSRTELPHSAFLTLRSESASFLRAFLTRLPLTTQFLSCESDGEPLLCQI